MWVAPKNSIFGVENFLQIPFAPHHYYREPRPLHGFAENVCSLVVSYVTKLLLDLHKGLVKQQEDLKMSVGCHYRDITISNLRDFSLVITYKIISQKINFIHSFKFSEESGFLYTRYVLNFNISEPFDTDTMCLKINVLY